MKKKDWIQKLQSANREAKETNNSLKIRLVELEKEFNQLQSVNLPPIGIGASITETADFISANNMVPPSADFIVSQDKRR